MRTIEVEIEGETPLLMHSAMGMEETKAKKNPAKNYDAEADAEAVAYRNKKGELYLPSRCLKACILNAASWFKFGRNSAKQIIAGCTRINPMELTILDDKGKPLKDYVVDKRPVVIQRARIIRARPRIDTWKIRFDLIYNEDMIGSHIDTIKDIVSEAGQRVGLLDNRPQKYGENGTFKLTMFKPKA